MLHDANIKEFWQSAVPCVSNDNAYLFIYDLVHISLSVAFQRGHVRSTLQTD